MSHPAWVPGAELSPPVEQYTFLTTVPSPQPVIILIFRNYGVLGIMLSALHIFTDLILVLVCVGSPHGYPYISDSQGEFMGLCR